MKTRMVLVMSLAAVLMWNAAAFAAPKASHDDPQAGGPDGQRPPMSQMPGMMPGMGPGTGGPGGPMMMARPGAGAPDMLAIIMHRLDLTDAQREKIETIVDGSRDKMDAARNALDRAHRALDKAVAADANDAAIQSAAAALGTAIGNEAVLKVRQLKEVKAVLTPEQLKQLETLKAKAKERRFMPPKDAPDGEGRGPDAPPPPGNEAQPQ